LALRTKSKDWLALNQDNVVLVENPYPWNTGTCFYQWEGGLLPSLCVLAEIMFQPFSTILDFVLLEKKHDEH